MAVETRELTIQQLPDNSNVREFPISDKLKSYGVTRIAQIGTSLRIESEKYRPIISAFKYEDPGWSRKKYRESATKVITVDNGVAAAAQIIDDIEIHIISEGSRIYEENLRNGSNITSVSKDSQVETTIELTPDLTKEVSFKDIAAILSTSIKKDNAPKLITFCGFLLAQTNEDQLNIGYQAESSAGKSYIPLEVANYFPENEIEKLASASPTAFYHDGGIWDKERKLLIKDMEHKNLIFTDMPHFQLLEKLRPLLSHDMKELHYKITDKDQKKGLRTKNVIIKGYPSVFFCTTKADPDDQEKTRMILLSPAIDQEKLKEALELSSLRKGNPEEYKRRISEDPKRAWLMQRISAIRQWGIREIIIPDCGKPVFDRFIKEHLYLMPRHQRDLPRIFGFIKASALLNCFNREKRDTDTIIATQADIESGFALYREIEMPNELGLSPYIFKIYTDVIAPLLTVKTDDGIEVVGEGGVSRENILKNYYKVRHKPLSPGTLKRDILPQLEAVGLISQQPDPGGDKRILLVYPTVSSHLFSQYDKIYVHNDSGVTPQKNSDSNTNKGIDAYSNEEEDEEDETLGNDAEE